MRRIWGIFVVCLILALTGCSSATLDASKKIVPPNNKISPLYGEWRIEKCLTKSPTENLWVGKAGRFTSKTAELGGRFWDNVNYKIKRVNAEEYFLFKYNGSVKELGIEDKEIFVITVSSRGNFLYEFIKVNNSKAIVEIEDELFLMEKISDDANGKAYTYSDGKSEDKADINRRVKQVLRSGLLLGIRTAEGQENSTRYDPGKYSYRTLWIAAENRRLHPVLEADNIFLPRKNGFWKLEVKEAIGNGVILDIPIAYSISESGLSSLGSINKHIAFLKSREGVLRRKILYAGNDYVCIESMGSGKYKNSSKAWEENRLQTLPVDNILNSEGVKITDVAGENGTLAMKSGISDMLSVSNTNIAMEIMEGEQERSFALYRKTGHWYIKGRLNLRDNSAVPFLDFNINLIPPAELVAYDMFHLSWTYIKDRIPEAVDAYTSPNKDIAIVLTKNELLIYSLYQGKLSDTPLKRIQLKKSDSVVMAEWATGSYMEKWEDAFKKNNQVREIK